MTYVHIISQQHNRNMIHNMIHEIIPTTITVTIATSTAIGKEYNYIPSNGTAAMARSDRTKSRCDLQIYRKFDRIEMDKFCSLYMLTLVYI